jgi:hypothetical protein
VVDALSRRAHEVHVSSINMYRKYLKDKIIEASNSYLNYLQTKEKLQQSNSQQKIKNYESKEDGIFLYKGKVYVPNYMDPDSVNLNTSIG